MAKKTGVHPLVEEIVIKGQEAGLNLYQLSLQINISSGSLTKWVNGKSIPTDASLRKVKKAIRRLDNGEITKVNNSGKKAPNQVIQEHWPEERKEMYRKIYKVENEYGSFSKVPDTDTNLYELHTYLGVKPLKYNKDGSIKYCRLELEKLRKEHNLFFKDMSEISGNGPGWYNNFMTGRDFTEEQATVFADYFGVPVENLLNSEYREEVIADAKS